MKITRTFVFVAFLALLTGCSTTVESSKRVAELQAPPQGLVVIWGSLREPTFSNLPALGAAPIGTSRKDFFTLYPYEHRAFGEALQKTLEAAPQIKGRMSFVQLLAGQSAADHNAAADAASKSSAVVHLYPERVTSYCSAGCYAFKVRVDYLSPVTRKVVWTGVIDSPPKNARDPIEPLAAKFSEVLLNQLAAEKLLPP